MVELGQTPDRSPVHAADALGPRMLSVFVDPEDDSELRWSEAEGGGHAGAGRKPRTMDRGDGPRSAQGALRRAT